MSRSKTFVKPETFSGFQKMFGHIYNKVNKAYYSEEHMLARMTVEVSRLLEVARKDRREEFKIWLPRVFSWYNGTANMLGINLQEALWCKYPGVCYYCLREKDCSCTVEHDHIENREDILRRLKRERKDREPITLREHQLMHRRLYFRQNDRIMLIQTVSHIAEEAGEVAIEYYNKNLVGLTDEMADVGSWIFATTNRLDLDLEDLVWKQYPYECEKCHQDQCVCKQPV